VFQPTKNAFVDTLRSVVADVKWFLLFLVLTMWGFAGAFYILFREDQQQFQVSLPCHKRWLVHIEQRSDRKLLETGYYVAGGKTAHLCLWTGCTI